MTKLQKCDGCIFDCEQPILLSINDRKYRGHKECMRKLQQKHAKVVSVSRHKTNW